MWFTEGHHSLAFGDKLDELIAELLLLGGLGGVLWGGWTGGLSGINN